MSKFLLLIPNFSLALNFWIMIIGIIFELVNEINTFLIFISLHIGIVRFLEHLETDYYMFLNSILSANALFLSAVVSYQFLHAIFIYFWSNLLKLLIVLGADPNKLSGLLYEITRDEQFDLIICMLDYGFDKDIYLNHIRTDIEFNSRMGIITRVFDSPNAFSNGNDISTNHIATARDLMTHSDSIDIFNYLLDLSHTLIDSYMITSLIARSSQIAKLSAIIEKTDMKNIKFFNLDNHPTLAKFTLDQAISYGKHEIIELLLKYERIQAEDLHMVYRIKYDTKFKDSIANKQIENDPDTKELPICLISRAEIEAGAYYYQCPNKAHHVYEAEEFVKLKEPKCLLCKCEITALFCNKN